MKRKIEVFLISCALVCLSVIASHAQQAQTDVKAETAEWQNAFTRAIESATFENGKLGSIRLSLPNDRERYLTFEHSQDGRSFTILEDGRRTVVFIDDQRRITSMVFPDGKKAVFEWTQGPNRFWIPKAIKVDGNVITSSLTEADCYDVCRNAAAASTIALGVCAATGPTSVACWSATASAAYATYVCYRCANPQIECPPDN